MNERVKYSDNILVQGHRWGTEFMQVTFQEPEASYAPYIVSLTRYCTPGRLDTYSFDWVPPLVGVGARIHFFSEGRPGLTMATALKLLQEDLDKPQVVQLIVEACSKPELMRYSRRLTEDLLASLAPKSKSLRAARKAIAKIVEQRRKECHENARPTVK